MSLLMLGNLKVNEIEDRAGVIFPDELKEFMRESHQSTASNVAKGKWHCFDIPFTLVCGDMETATKIYTHLKDLDFKKTLQISISGD